MNQNHLERVLTTKNPNFGFLFGGEEASQGGIVVSCKKSDFIDMPDEGLVCKNPCGISVMIEGFSGCGKTILACNLCASSLNKGEFAIIYSLDQSGEEIRAVFDQFGFLDSEAVGVLSEDKSLPNERFMEGKITVWIRELRSNTTINELIGFLSHDFHLATNEGTPDPRMIPSIIVLDSMNTVLRSKHDYRFQFERLARFPVWNKCIRPALKSSGRRPLAKIFTFENPEEPGPVEEYLCDCVIELKKLGAVRTTRVLEIKKTRGQPSFIGSHEFEIRSSKAKGQKGGIYVYPNLHSRSQSIRIDDSEDKKIPHVNFGLPVELLSLKGNEKNSRIESVNGICDPIMVPSGTATLLWGVPGTFKTWIGAHFVLHRGIDESNSDIENMASESALFITFKIEKAAVEMYLTKVREQREEFRLDPKYTRAHNEVEIITAKDPFESPEAVLSKTITHVRGTADDSEPGSRAVKRAVVFGLLRLKQIPAYENASWEFLEVLSKYFRSKRITTLFIDWPEPKQGDSTPMVIDLCANEMRTEKEEVDGKLCVHLDVRRLNYQVFGNKYLVKKPF